MLGGEALRSISIRRKTHGEHRESALPRAVEDDDARAPCSTTKLAAGDGVSGASSKPPA
jgi:hypothetical protein